MDPALAYQLRTDKKLYDDLTRLVKDYVTLGFRGVEYWVPEWDAAHDMLMCYAALTKSDLEKLEKGHPKRFVLPMTANQINTMTTYVAQVLYGSKSPHKVTGRGPEDEVPAAHMNTLLEWNAEQQPTYVLGTLFVQDALTFNRGIMYNSWAPIYRPEFEEVTVTVPDELDAEGNLREFKTFRRKNKRVGGFCKMDLVAPYDWICDPAVPLRSLQEGRFAGHRFKVSWTELKRRSTLNPDDPAYVLPSAVEELKKRRQNTNSTIGVNLTITAGVAAQAQTPTAGMSRSMFERTRSTGPLLPESANVTDPGPIDCVELWVRLVPKDQKIHDGTEPVLFQFVVASNDIILSVVESPHMHDNYPYSVAEGRPGAHYQFTPSWALMLKGLQDHVDYLKNRHQEALQRTVGNIFIVDPRYVDVEDFLNPDKEGLLMLLKPEAAGQKMGDIFQQVAIKDLTENFPSEMQGMIQFAETVTGASNNMQGVPGSDSSATEFAGTQQMAGARLMSIARSISVQALVPQAQQFVTMFQQYLEAAQAVRFTPDPFSTPQPLMSAKTLTITPDTIQGTFDFVAHDGAMPTGDNKQVAAITALLAAAAPFSQVFQPAPGNIDPRLLLLAGAKAAGLADVERFQYAADGAAAATAGQVQLAMPGMMPTGPAPEAPSSMQPPGPAPENPMAPPAPDVAPLPTVMPPQARPQNI